MKKNFKKYKGFTLIELLVSFSIVSLLALVAMPVYHAIAKNIALNGEAQQLIDDLRMVQQRSITSQGGVSHGIHLNDESYDVLSGENLVYTRQLKNNAQISFGSGSNIIFNRLIGNLEETNDQEIIINLEGRNKTIKINSNGRIFSL